MKEGGGMDQGGRVKMMNMVEEVGADVIMGEGTVITSLACGGHSPAFTSEG